MHWRFVGTKDRSTRASAAGSKVRTIRAEPNSVRVCDRAEFACLEMFPVDAVAARGIDALAGVKGRVSEVVVRRAIEATVPGRAVIAGLVEPPDAGGDTGNLCRPRVVVAIMLVAVPHPDDAPVVFVPARFLEEEYRGVRQVTRRVFNHTGTSSLDHRDAVTPQFSVPGGEHSRRVRVDVAGIVGLSRCLEVWVSCGDLAGGNSKRCVASEDSDRSGAWGIDNRGGQGRAGRELGPF